MQLNKSNGESAFPEEIFDYDYIEEIVINGYKGRVLPNKFSYFKSLKALTILDSNTHSLPSSLTNNSQLIRVQICDTPLQHIKLSNLQALRRVELINTRIVGKLSGLEILKNLKWLNITNSNGIILYEVQLIDMQTCKVFLAKEQTLQSSDIYSHKYVHFV